MSNILWLIFVWIGKVVCNCSNCRNCSNCLQDTKLFLVEHAVKEQCKIRTDWIGHLGKAVEQIDPVGRRVTAILRFLLFLSVDCSSLFNEFLLWEWVTIILSSWVAAAISTIRAASSVAAVIKPASPWPSLVFCVVSQLRLTDKQRNVPKSYK